MLSYLEEYLYRRMTAAYERMANERRIKMNKYKVGDKITLKKDLNIMDSFEGTCFVDSMEKYKTLPLTIIKIPEDNLYETKGTADDDTNWYVRTEMIEGKWNEVMNISKALECMKQGMKVRATQWNEDEYIYYENENILDENDLIYHIDGRDLEYEWVEYIEKEEVKQEKLEKLRDYYIDTKDAELLALLRDLKKSVNKLIDVYNGEKDV